MNQELENILTASVIVVSYMFLETLVYAITIYQP